MCVGLLFNKRVEQKKNDPLAAFHQKLEGLKVITHYHALIIMHLCG